MIIMSLADELWTDLEENGDSNRMVDKRKPEPDFIPPNVYKSVEERYFLYHIVFYISITFLNFFLL